MTMENTPISPELEKLLAESKPLSEITDANSHCPDAFGSVTDKQRIDWLFQECEIRRLDDNGAPYGQDLMNRSEIDAEIQSQNLKHTDA